MDTEESALIISSKWKLFVLQKRSCLYNILFSLLLLCFEKVASKM